MSVVAVLGAGTVGQTLATGWARAGHEVVLGSRAPETDRVRAAVAATGARRAARHADAARDADLVVVTVRATRSTRWSASWARRCATAR
jgi:predicted dinucleotide-binding enzyme